VLAFGGGGKIGPGVAEKWELAKDGLSWTFYLRKGLVFHNGDSLTSADVKFSLERTMSKESILSEGTRLRKAIKEIELIDDLTLRIHTQAVNVTLEGEMSPVVGQGGQIMPKKYIETNSLDHIAKNAVGSGPWKFARHVKGDRVEFEAWDKSYRGTPHFQKLILLLVPEESTRVAMLRTDQAYVTDLTAETAKEVLAAKMQLVKIGGAAMYIFQFWGLFLPEHKDSPLNNIKVREALSLAINRQEIIDFVMEGYGSLPMPFASFRNTFDLDLERWEKFSREGLRYDPVKAKQLLTEAGYPQGFRMTYYTSNFPGTPFMNKISTAVAGYWEKVGVKVDLKEQEFGVFSDLALAEGHRDPKAPFNGAVSIYRNAGRPDAVPRYFTTFHPDGSHYIFGEKQFTTPEGQEFAKLYKEIPTELDTVVRAKKFNRMVELVTSSWMAPSILEAVVLYGANPKRVGKWEANYGRAELGDLFERIPHPDTHPW
jgi:ABC-type transport system substrate-binding protein